MKTPEEIKKDWQDSIKYAEENDYDMDDASFGYEEGMVISFNDAKIILESNESCAKETAREAWKEIRRDWKCKRKFDQWYEEWRAAE